ncbi:hypothetical protein H4R33_000311 [Dimargaris cristalligena]|nr:hypothetical protein H4R33_000311 [Dimargaris cristalligena]
MESSSSSSPTLPSYPPSSPEHPHLPAYLSPTRDIPELSIRDSPRGDTQSSGAQGPAPMDQDSPTETTRHFIRSQSTCMPAHTQPIRPLGRAASFRVAPVGHLSEEDYEELFYSATASSSHGKYPLLRKANSCEEPPQQTPAPAVLYDTPVGPKASSTSSDQRLHPFTSQFDSNGPFGQVPPVPMGWPTPQSPTHSRSSPYSGALPHTPSPAYHTGPLQGFAAGEQAPSALLSPLGSGFSSVTPLHTLSHNYSGCAMQVDEAAPVGNGWSLAHSPLGRRSQSFYPSPTSVHRPDKRPWASTAPLKRKLLFDDCGLDQGLTQARREATSQAVRIIRKTIDEGTQTTVNLSDMDLVAVPEEVAELQHLVAMCPNATFRTDLILYLNQNALTYLPSALFSLTNVTVLILSNNHLKVIPPAIGRLVNLKELSLGKNELQFLPSEVLALPQLNILNIHPNPLVPPPRPGHGLSVQQRGSLLQLVLPADMQSAHSDIADSEAGHPFPPPQSPFREQLLIFHGFPTLVESSARVIAQNSRIVFSTGVATPVQTERPDPDSKRRRGTQPLVPTKQMLPSYLREALDAASSNHCSVCRGSFATPYLEELVWAPVCEQDGIPVLMRVCSPACRYTDKWSQYLQQI